MIFNLGEPIGRVKFRFGDSFQIECEMTEDGLTIRKIGFDGRDTINIIPEVSNKILIK